MIQYDPIYLLKHLNERLDIYPSQVEFLGWLKSLEWSSRPRFYDILWNFNDNILANTLWCHQTTARWKIPELNGGFNWQTLCSTESNHWTGSATILTRISPHKKTYIFVDLRVFADILTFYFWYFCGFLRRVKFVSLTWATGAMGFRKNNCCFHAFSEAFSRRLGELRCFHEFQGDFRKMSANTEVHWNFLGFGCFRYFFIMMDFRFVVTSICLF